MINNLFRYKRDRDRGASMVEFALAFPLIVLLIIFLFDTGLFLYKQALLIDATASVNRQITTVLGQREAAVTQVAGVTVPVAATEPARGRGKRR